MAVSEFSLNFAREPVPAESQKGWSSLAAVWSATFLCMPVLALAFQIAPKLSFGHFIAYSFLAGLLVAMLACGSGWIGTATRLSTGMVFKSTFGTQGAIIPCLIIAISTLGWFGLQVEIFGHGLTNLLELTSGFRVPVWVCIVFGTLLMSVTGAIGFRALMLLSYITIPLMIYVLIWPLVKAFDAGELEGVLMYTLSEEMEWHEVLTLLAGGIFTGIVINPDFTRYMHSQKHMLVGTSVNFLILYPFMLVLGGLLALLTNASDFLTMMLSLNLGIAAMIFLVIGTWTTNDTNLYSISLLLAAIFNVKKWQLAIGAAILGAVLALMGILGNFVSFLIVLGLVLSPIMGVMVVDFLFNRKNYRVNALQEKWNFLAFLAWLFGGLVGLSATTKENGGFELLTLTHIPPIDGLLVAGFLQFLFIFLAKLKK